MTHISRRHLLAGLGTAGFASSLGAFSSFTGSRAWAANTTGYKAMVCLFLYGGMDQGDTILPYDQTSYDQLRAVREGLFNTYNANSSTSSRNRANLLKLNPVNAGSLGGRELAMPRELAPLHGLFESGELAVIGNVGPLAEVTTRAQMENGTAILPPRLFSHNDQQSTWMSLDVEGSRYGWGGRFMDEVLKSAPSASAVFSTISTGSNDVFLAGENARPFRVTSNGAPEPVLISKRWYLGYTDEDDAARQKIQDFLRRTDVNSRSLLERDLQGFKGRATANSELILQARQNVGPLVTQFEENSLASQLKSVAETIRIQQYLNVPRQLFLVTTGGFDTHNNQANSIAGLHTRLANAIASFREAMIEIGHWNDVVLFTASDFGRTVIDNGNGTDHGWGGHHFVTGGRVSGKRVFGSFPSAETNGPNYTENRGRLIPSVAVEQYAATLGSWFGLSGTELSAALPNLGRFDTQNLGFMQPSAT